MKNGDDHRYDEASDNIVFAAEGSHIPIATAVRDFPEYTTSTSHQQQTFGASVRSPKAQQQQQQESRGPSAWLRLGKGSPAALNSMLDKIRVEGKGLIDQSSQHVMSAIQKGTDKGNEVSDKMTSAFQQSQTKVKAAYISLKSVGESVQTSYGMGKVMAYDETTAMYRIQLSFGTLYTNSIQPKNKKKAATALELNSAYEMWEKARRKQVECECHRLGIPFTDSTLNQCFPCLQAPDDNKKKPMLADTNGNPLFPRLYSLRQSSHDMIQSKSQQPCLLCGAVVCTNHASPVFTKEGITVCLSCVHTLEFDVSQPHILPQDLQHHAHQLTELYSRARVLLQYVTPFVPATADRLEHDTKQHHHIAGVGGSGAGLVSGVLGVAAACTILTPAGAPLLVASLVFGGSATAVQTTSEAYKYYSEPNQLANRVITLYGILERIVATVKVMRDSTLLPYLDRAVVGKLGHNANPSNTNGAAAVVVPPPAVVAVKAGTRIGSMASTSAASMVAQEGALAGRFVTRATTAAARTARIARFAGGALSAATLVLEANEMRKTVEQLQLGSPCEKAQVLRNINVASLPASAYVERLCQSYLKVRSKELFQQAVVSLSEQAAPENLAPLPTGDLMLNEEASTLQSPTPASLPSEITTESTARSGEEDWCLVEEVLSSLEAEAEATSVQSKKLRSKTSLLERVKRYKQRENL